MTAGRFGGLKFLKEDKINHIKVTQLYHRDKTYDGTIFSKQISIPLPDGHTYIFSLVATRGQQGVNFWVGKTGLFFNPSSNTVCIPFEDKPFLTVRRNITVFHRLEIALPTIWKYNQEPDFSKTLTLCFFADTKKTISYEIYDKDSIVKAGNLFTLIEYLIVYKHNDRPNDKVIERTPRG